MIDSRFKAVCCDSDLMQMIVGHMDAEAYAFRAFDKWEDAVTKSFGKKYISDTWMAGRGIARGKGYLLLVDEQDAWIVDIDVVHTCIITAVQATTISMLNALE